MKQILKNLAKSTPVGLIPFIAGMITIYMVVNVAKIGFGGNIGSFLIGFGTAFVVALFAAVIVYAASPKSSTKLGAIIFTVIMLIEMGLALFGANLTGWDWVQFGYGIVILALLVVAIAPSYFFKYNWPRKRQTTLTSITPTGTAASAAS